MPRFSIRNDCTSVNAPEAKSSPYDRLPGDATETALADSNASTRPEPITVAETGEPSRLSFRSWTAEFMITALIRSGDQLGCSWRMSTATPATCGVAIEVPENFTPLSPVPASVDWMSNPGAEMSGLRSLVSRAGPSEVKSVIASVYAGITVVSAFSVALTVPLL